MRLSEGASGTGRISAGLGSVRRSGERSPGGREWRTVQTGHCHRGHRNAGVERAGSNASDSQNEPAHGGVGSDDASVGRSRSRSPKSRSTRIRAQIGRGSESHRRHGSVAPTQTVFTSGITDFVLSEFLSGRTASLDAAPGRNLTPREREIIQLLAEGKSNKEVAAVLNVSTRTIETHRANIMHKLGIHSLSGLVRYAIRNKIVHA